MSTAAASAADDKPGPPPTLLRRLLGLAWQYRHGCIRVVALQITLLTLGLMGLGLMGLGVDYIKYELHREALLSGAPAAVVPTVATADGATVHAPPKPPRWPLGWSPPRNWTRMQCLAAVAGLVLAFALTRALLNYFYNLWLAQLVQGQIVVDLRHMVYRKMQRLSFSFFDSNVSSSIINRVTGDVQSVRMFVDMVLVQSVILVLSLAVYLVYMVNLHMGLTLACLASSPLLWWLTKRFSETVQPAYRKNRELFDDMVLALSENLQGQHVVKGFAREQAEIERFRAANYRVAEHKRWIIRKVSLFAPLISFISHVNLFILLAYGGYLVIRYERAPDALTAAEVGISVGQLLVFAGLLQQFCGQVSNIANIANTMQQCLTGAQRVFEVIDAPVTIASPARPIALPQPRGELCFEHVRFGYQPGEDVLTDIDLHIEPGEWVAILGATGSGKSTLMSLVSRFYDPTAGRITLDGHDLRELELEELRRQIGVVFQENFLFSTTIAHNIAFGHPDATRAQIERAARVAAAHDFITAMPQGYDTVLHESGANLSGGQRQRLAIARAVLLEPAIMLLDDPTAAVDPQTEDEILVAMEQATRGRTTLVVAHRMSTLRRADRVIVLDQGRIVQSGTHAQLMAQPGYYQRVARLQVSGHAGYRHDPAREATS
jgi:ATP-binding cassette subfamily B protein